MDPFQIVMFKHHINCIEPIVTLCNFVIAPVVYYPTCCGVFVIAVVAF